MKTTMLRRARAASVAILTVTALALTGCGSDDEPAAAGADGEVDLTKVTLRAGDQKGVSAQALLEAAGLADTPYKIEWSSFTSGPPMLEALAADSIDVAMVGNTPPIFAAAAGSEFKVVAAAHYTASGDAIVVPNDSPATEVTDLTGKKVGVAPGSSANYNLLGQLNEAGMSLDDIEVVELQPADALAAFSSGKIDAWTIWEPYTSQAELDYDARVLVDGENGVMNGLNYQVAADSAIDDPATKAALADYLSRIQQAQIWSGDPANVETWPKIWAEGAGLDPAITEHATDRRPVDAVPISEEIIESTQTMADAFHEAGKLPVEVDIEDWFSDEFNDVASGAAVAGG